MTGICFIRTRCACFSENYVTVFNDITGIKYYVAQEIDTGIWRIWRRWI